MSCYIVHKNFGSSDFPLSQQRKRHHFLPRLNLSTLLLPVLKTSVHHISYLPPQLQNCSYLSQCNDKGFSIHNKKFNLSLDSTSPCSHGSTIGTVVRACGPFPIRPLLNPPPPGSVTTSFQLLFVKSTMTSLMYYLMNYFQSLSSFFCEMLSFETLFSFGDTSLYLSGCSFSLSDALTL